MEQQVVDGEWLSGGARGAEVGGEGRVGKAGVAKSYASLWRFMPSYKLTVSHSHVKLKKS
jgi:hypothetical protein